MTHTHPRSALLLLVLCLFLSACAGTPPAANNSTPRASPARAATVATPLASPLTGFAKDLQYVRNGGFTYIYTFARKDGKPLDRDDGAFLRTTAPQVVDWVTTDQGRKVIGGTNF